jgi:hypothetical protein
LGVVLEARLSLFQFLIGQIVGFQSAG